MPDHNYFANLIWQIADLLRGPYRPPQYERVMLPMTVLRRFDCVLAPTKAKVLAEHGRSKDKFKGEALDARLNKAAGQRFHNHSPLDFEKLKGPTLTRRVHRNRPQVRTQADSAGDFAAGSVCTRHGRPCQVASRMRAGGGIFS